jgi:hypothetical protein
VLQGKSTVHEKVPVVRTAHRHISTDPGGRRKTRQRKIERKDRDRKTAGKNRERERKRERERTEKGQVTERLSRREGGHSPSRIK